MLSLKRSLEKNPAKKEKAFSEMKKFMEKGRCEKLTDEEREIRAWNERLAYSALRCHLYSNVATVVAREEYI